MGSKVTVVGAGFYGSTTAMRLAEYNIFDTVVLTDILEGKPEGLALDMNQSRSKPSDAATLESADIVFINGLVLEEPTKDLALANIRQGSSVCELGTETLPESEYIYDFSFPKEGGKPNPHLWTNPPMAKQYAQVVRDVLVRRDPSNAAIYERNFSAFALKIDALDERNKDCDCDYP